MSYSFGVIAESKADAKARVHAEFDKVVAGQPEHAADRPAAEQAVGALIDCLEDSDVVQRAKSVNVTVSGSLSGKWENGGIVSVQAAQLNVGVSYINR